MITIVKNSPRTVRRTDLRVGDWFLYKDESGVGTIIEPTRALSFPCDGTPWISTSLFFSGEPVLKIDPPTFDIKVTL